MELNPLISSLVKPLHPRGDLSICRVADLDAYAAYAGEMRREIERRMGIEHALIQERSSFLVDGLCHVCQRTVSFLVDFAYSYEVDGILTPNWRERLVCPRCNLNNRMRAAIHVLEQECLVPSTASIYITERTTALYRAISLRYPNTIGSEFLGDSVGLGGTNSQGIRNEDLTRLTFPDDAFDAVLSFDVLEHVPDFGAGLAQCLRCLKPGGTLLFSVPFRFDLEHNVVRARVESNGTVKHCLPPEYHGDPLCDKGILCYHDFGWELFDKLRSVGFEEATALLYWSLTYGYLGGNQYLFVAKKPSTRKTG